MIPHSPPLTNFIHAPKVKPHTIQESQDGYNGKAPGRVHRQSVAEIQERACNCAQIDRELKPREEGTLCRKVDFRLNANGDEDTCDEVVSNDAQSNRRRKGGLRLPGGALNFREYVIP